MTYLERKISLKAYLIQKLETTDNVASQIRNLVASMDATERDNRPDINMSMKYDTRFEEQLQPTARVSLPVSNNSSKNSESDPWDKVGLEETDRKTSKVTWLSFKKYQCHPCSNWHH